MYTLNDADSPKDVPFEGLDDEKYCLGVKTPKNANIGGGNRRFKPNLQNFQIAISRKVVERLK